MESQEDDITKLQRMQESYSEEHTNTLFSIYVKNLDTSVNNSDMVTHFKSCGNIFGINIFGGKNCKRYAVIDFASEKSAEIALILNGSVLKGKKIVVQRKRDFNKKQG